MKTIVAGLIFIAVCLFIYNRQHPFGRPSIPDGHEYAADGVYFLRTAYTVPAPSGPVQWKQGQQVFADRLTKTTAPEGTRLVTDGTHSAPLPTNMLSEDVQEGQALRQADLDAQNKAAQMQAQAQAQAQAQVQAQAQEQALAQTQAQAAAKAEQQRLRAEAEARTAEARLRTAEARHPVPTPTPTFGHTALDQPTLVKPARPYYGRNYYVPTPTP